MYKAIKAPFLVVMGSKLNEVDKELKRFAESVNPNFVVEEVDREEEIIGAHYVHLNYPAKTWEKVEPFLRKYDGVISNSTKSRL